MLGKLFFWCWWFLLLDLGSSIIDNLEPSWRPLGSSYDNPMGPMNNPMDPMNGRAVSVIPIIDIATLGVGKLATKAGELVLKSSAARSVCVTVGLCIAPKYVAEKIRDVSVDFITKDLTREATKKSIDTLNRIKSGTIHGK